MKKLYRCIEIHERVGDVIKVTCRGGRDRPKGYTREMWDDYLSQFNHEYPAPYKVKCIETKSMNPEDK